MSITGISSSTKPKILVILGPTASGKSSLAVKLAKKLIDLADSALYAAKGKDGNGGRNRTVLADAQKDPVYNQYQIDQAAARG